MFQEVEVSDTTGAIRGLVVSEAIQPIEGVLIQLTGAESTTTDEQGGFVFSNLEPGDYFVTAAKLGYHPQQSHTTVVAGDKQPPITKIVLLVDAATTPFANLQVWNGFLQCGVTTRVQHGQSGVPSGLGANACGALDDRFIFYFSMATITDFAQAEMVWKNTQSLSPELSLGYYQGGTTNFKNIQGPSPLILNTTKEQIQDRRGNESDELPMRVFPPYANSPGAGLPAVGVGMTVNQAFDVYMHMFWGFLPREGWTFIENGPCTRPEECGS